MNESGLSGPALDELVRWMGILADSVEADPAFDVEAFLAEHPTHAPLLRAGLTGLARAGFVGESEASDAMLAALSSCSVERYEIQSQIGRGGMGAVYRAFDRDLRRHVALKTIRSDLSLAEQAAAGRLLIARFLNEARVTGLLEHPGVVPVHDLGLLDGRPFFTMKLVGGRSLARRIGSSTTARGIDLATALTIVERVCEAMAFAHSLGVVHRDLKPANIMVGDFGEVYVMDWGLAKVVAPARRPGAQPHAPVDSRAVVGESAPEAPPDEEQISLHGDRIGTLEYMSPEQAHGNLEAIDPRTDVFGLGAILFHVLTGDAPYRCEDRSTALRAAQQAEPLRHAPAAFVPRELEAICRKAMALDPAQRYPSARALAADLRAYRYGKPGDAWTDSSPRRFAKAVRRHPTAFAVVVALSIVLSLTATGSWWLQTLGAERNAFAQREKEANLSRQLLQLSEIEGTPFDMHEQVRRYEQSVHSIQELLADWGVVLDGSVAPAALANRIRAEEARVQSNLLDTLFLLAQHIGRVEIARASLEEDSPDREAELDERLGEPRVAPVSWPLLVDLVEELVPRSHGSRALAAYAAWLVDPRASCALEGEPPPDASPGEVYFSAWVIERLRGPTEAAKLLDRVLERRPDLVWCHLRRGILALSGSDWDRAIAHGTAGLALWPSSSTARNILGLALEGKGERVAAEEQYRAAIERYPDDLASLFRLGCILRERGDASDLREEIELLERAHCVAPDDIESASSLGETLTAHAPATGHELETAHALELLFRARRLAPHSWLARYLSECPLPVPAEASNVAQRAAD